MWMRACGLPGKCREIGAWQSAQTWLPTYSAPAICGGLTTVRWREEQETTAPAASSKRQVPPVQSRRRGQASGEGGSRRNRVKNGSGQPCVEKTCRSLWAKFFRLICGRDVGDFCETFQAETARGRWFRVFLIRICFGFPVLRSRVKSGAVLSSNTAEGGRYSDFGFGCGYVRARKCSGLVWILHIPIENSTMRRVRAREPTRTWFGDCRPRGQIRNPNIEIRNKSE